MRRVYLAGPPYADEYRRRAEALVRRLGWEPVDPMRRDFRGRTQGKEGEIVEGDLADIDSCEAVLAAFTAPDEGTAMEAWYAHTIGKFVVAYTGGTPPHPWTVYVADAVHGELERAVAALADSDSRIDTPPGRPAACVQRSDVQVRVVEHAARGRVQRGREEDPDREPDRRKRGGASSSRSRR